MGSYPNQYPAAAIAVAEHLVKSAIESRLIKESWRWRAYRGFLMSSEQLGEIRSCLGRGVGDEELLRFVGLVFSKVLPETHYEFVSDGFLLDIGGDETARTIVVNELPECFHGYEGAGRRDRLEAAQEAIRSLLKWRLATNGGKWPVGETGGADLVFGDLYCWIKGIGEFGYCRTRNVIEFIYAAVPEFREEWEAEGLTLIPRYHVERNGRGRFTTLRLVQTPPRLV